MIKETNRISSDGSSLMDHYKGTDLIGNVVVIISTLFFCVSMTTFDDSRNWFKFSFDLLMAGCIIYGLAVNIKNYKKIEKHVLLITLLYFVFRLISYALNGVPVTFGGALMLQAFYLIGINKYLFGGKQRLKTVLITFVSFDVAIMALNYFNYLFRPEYVARALEKYEEKGMLAATNMFQSKNYAGMIAGATIIICIAAILNKKFEKKTTLLLIPVIALNLLMLAVHSHCRSGQTGLIVITCLTVAILVIKKIDSTKRVVGISLIVCFMTLIPIYVLVYWNDNDEYLANMTPAEQLIDDASSYRYAIWKTTILSQEGHLLFGFGNTTTAAKKKSEYINNFDPEKVSLSYSLAADHRRQHNGYLAFINEAGLTGSIAFIILLLARISKFKGRFRDGQWEKLLLVYIFWINLFEAKFILANFFTGFLMMILLLPPVEEAPEI